MSVIKKIIIDSTNDDRYFTEVATLEPDGPTVVVGVTSVPEDRWGIFRWQIPVQEESTILDATISYYVSLTTDTLPNTEYHPIDSTNVGRFVSPVIESQDVRNGDQKLSGTFPGTTGWKRRNITSWIQWFVGNDHYKEGYYFGIRFGPGSGVANNNFYHIRDKSQGDGNEAFLWISYLDVLKKSGVGFEATKVRMKRV